MFHFLRYDKENLFFFIIVFVISLVFTKYYFLYTHEYYPPAQSDRIANFEADKVFQKRFLVPVIANTLSETTSISFDHSLKFIVFISTIGIILGFKEMMNIFVSHSHIQYISLFVLIPISWNYIALNSIFHSYDIPAICLYCYGVILFIKNKFFFFLHNIHNLNSQQGIIMLYNNINIAFKIQL